MTGKRLAAAALAVAAIGAGGGAAAVGLSGAGDGTHTVTVTSAAAATPVAATSDLSVGEIYRRAQAGVVELKVTTSGGSSGGSGPFPFGGGSASAEGSGFVIDANGDVVTNAHVVDGATSISVTFADGSTAKAKLVGADASTDVAVVRVSADAAKLHPLAWGDSSSLSVGDGVVAIGAPFGLDGTVTSGIVSALGREIQAPDGSPISDTIQTDAAINHGNSGGPLFDLHGNVVGITSQIESDSGGNDGIGFAVASATAKKIAAELSAHGKAQHALLGVQVRTASGGVGVQTVQPGSGAAKAGLKAGDVVTAVEGKPVATATALRAAIDRHAPGDRIAVTIRRGSSEKTVHVVLGSR